MGKGPVTRLSSETGGLRCGNFFSLQVGAETEGSGQEWGLDIGSASGDLVDREELLRVSV